MASKIDDLKLIDSQPPILRQRPVVVLFRDRFLFAVVAKEVQTWLVQEIQLSDVCGARRRKPSHLVHPQFRRLWCQ